MELRVFSSVLAREVAHTSSRCVEVPAAAPNGWSVPPCSLPFGLTVAALVHLESTYMVVKPIQVA
jgi:hypothetical protein